MTGFAEDALSRDAFLGGRVHLWQPVRGYRAGVDPVILAAATPARAGQSVLELGCGAGAAVLCLGARVPGLRLTGLELQPDYAALARRNAAENGIALEVIEGDLAQMPATLRAQSFDHVIANPPYFDRAHSTPAPDAGRDTALGGDTPLAVWIDAATRRLAPKGQLTLIQRAERLPEILSALDSRMGGMVVQPLAPRAGRAAKLVLIGAVKGARGPFRLAPQMVLHEGSNHGQDGEDYTRTFSEILRNAAALPRFDE